MFVSFSDPWRPDRCDSSWVCEMFDVSRGLLSERPIVISVTPTVYLRSVRVANGLWGADTLQLLPVAFINSTALLARPLHSGAHLASLVWPALFYIMEHLLYRITLFESKAIWLLQSWNSFKSRVYFIV